MAGPLSHLRILDLSRVLAGPWATQILADLGAEVIKIERPGTGDDTRAWGPPYLKDAAGNDTGESAYYLAANRNKQSVAVDLAQAEGAAIVRALLPHCDVLVENFKVGGLAQYGLDYETLRQAFPRLIYCSITGFGQTGPYAARPGYDFLIQGMGGLMSLTGLPDGTPGAGPLRVGVAQTDIMTGLYATIAIQAALTHRDKTGEGQHLDLALLDVQVACLANQAMNFLATGVSPGRLGNAHPNVVPYQEFPTQDGYMILAIGNDSQFASFCRAAGAAALAADESLKTNSGRQINRARLIPAMRDITVTRTTADWITLLEAAGVPCGPINDLAAVFDDPQVKARQMRRDLPHPAGTAPTLASPIRMSASPVSYHSAPPLLGGQTDAVLARVLGFDAAKLSALRAAGVIGG